MRPGGDFDLSLGQAILARRVALGMTRNSLAAVLGLSPSVLRRIEEGLSSISAADLLRVAAALDLDPHELLMEPRIQEHSDASRLIAAWLTINRARDRGAVLAFLQTLGDG